MKTVMQKIRTLAISLIICSCAQNNGNRVQAQNTTPEDTTTRQVTLLFAGDLMQHDGQIKAARTADGYDYTDVFARVKPEVSRYDIAVANFEVTLAGPPYKGYPCFSAPDEYLRAIIDAGFDVMLTSNNHSCDTRAKGLERTIVMMDSWGLTAIRKSASRTIRLSSSATAYASPCSISPTERTAFLCLHHTSSILKIPHK